MTKEELLELSSRLPKDRVFIGFSSLSGRFVPWVPDVELNQTLIPLGDLTVDMVGWSKPHPKTGVVQVEVKSSTAIVDNNRVHVGGNKYYVSAESNVFDYYVEGGQYRRGLVRYRTLEHLFGEAHPRFADMADRCKHLLDPQLREHYPYLTNGDQYATAPQILCCAELGVTEKYPLTPRTGRPPSALAAKTESVPLYEHAAMMLSRNGISARNPSTAAPLRGLCSPANGSVVGIDDATVEVVYKQDGQAMRERYSADEMKQQLAGIFDALFRDPCDVHLIPVVAKGEVRVVGPGQALFTPLPIQSRNKPYLPEQIQRLQADIRIGIEYLTVLASLKIVDTKVLVDAEFAFNRTEPFVLLDPMHAIQSVSKFKGTQWSHVPNKSAYIVDRADILIDMWHTAVHVPSAYHQKPAVKPAKPKPQFVKPVVSDFGQPALDAVLTELKKMAQSKTTPPEPAAQAVAEPAPAAVPETAEAQAAETQAMV